VEGYSVYVEVSPESSLLDFSSSVALPTGCRSLALTFGYSPVNETPRNMTNDDLTDDAWNSMRESKATALVWSHKVQNVEVRRGISGFVA